MTAPGASGKTQLIVPPVLEGTKRAYKLYADQDAVAADVLSPTGTITIGSSAGNWTDMTSTPNLVNDVTAGTNKIVRVVDVDATNHPISVGSAIVNKG